MESCLNRGLACLLLIAALAGCRQEKPYGSEVQLSLPGRRVQVWAIAPAVNLSGQRVDPLLQADLVYQQLQQVHGLTVVPVNRVVEVYVGLGLEHVQSQEQADQVCRLLGCDALLVPSVTAYDPYKPPKFGVALQLFIQNKSTPAAGSFLQVVGMFDAANGTTRGQLLNYAEGRNDPAGPFGAEEYLVSMDRYCGFAYWTLIRQLLESPRVGEVGGE